MRHRLDSKGQRKGKVDSKRYEWVRVDSWDNLSGKNGIGTPKEFLILAFLGCGITSFSLVNWPTLLVVMLMTSKKPRHIQKIYHLIVEGYWRKLKMRTDKERIRESRTFEQDSMPGFEQAL
eukprot:XP_024451531.1 uncharacterized protein LOC7474562 isoform X4 [Populus trichocarpa]